MRRSMDGLAIQMQEALQRDPHGWHLFVFRGKRGKLSTAERKCIGVAAQRCIMA
jgi:hypothetical protein